MNQTLMKAFGFEFDEEKEVWWRNMKYVDVRITFDTIPTLDELWDKVEAEITNEIQTWDLNSEKY